MRTFAILWLIIMVAICGWTTFAAYIMDHPAIVIGCIGATLFSYAVVIDDGPKRAKYRGHVVTDWREKV